jgi:hypothetical protein
MPIHDTSGFMPNNLNNTLTDTQGSLLFAFSRKVVLYKPFMGIVLM